MNCPQNEKNKKNCTCTYPCSIKGMCCECVAAHRNSGQLPACYFPPEAEKTSNRSIAYFVELFQAGIIKG